MAVHTRVDPAVLADHELISRNPVDGSFVASFRALSPEEVTVLVERDRAAQRWWWDIGFRSRAEHLRRWRRLVRASSSEVADLIHRETGKSLDAALLEVTRTVEVMAWAERNAERALRGRRVTPGLSLANVTARVEHAPVGVVGVISPANNPLYTPNSHAVFALAVGNTVVLKPSEHTTAVAEWYVRAFHRANPLVPVGCISLATGFGETGHALCGSGVDKIAFTGSAGVGSVVVAACASGPTPVVLGCGGNNAAIVAADADVEEAARAIAWGAFTDTGQVCAGVRSVYVDSAVAQHFTAALVRHTRALERGPLGAGPVVPSSRRHIFRTHVRDAVEAGSGVVLSTAPSSDDRRVGPVILRDVPEECAVVGEETFGPILTLRSIETMNDAVELANSGEYGPRTAVFSKRNAASIAERLEAGQICLNSVDSFAAMAAVPTGGAKAGGFGRVHGDEGLREFSKPRTILRKKYVVRGFCITRLDESRRLLPITEVIGRLCRGITHRR